MKLEFRCVHRYPAGFELDLSFATDHRVTAFFGPSGSGKTSILSMIAGLTPPDEGRITTDGRILFDRAQGINLRPERRGAALVFQDHLLFPHRTVEANLRYGLRRRGQRQVRIEFDRVVAALELQALLNRYPATLSGGEKQRTSLGRALLSQPDLLLLDEPWSALDEALRQRIFVYLERIRADWALPMLLVSHDQASVRRLADWVLVLDRGRKIGEGPPQDALSQAIPLGWKGDLRPMNLLRVEDLQQQDGRWTGRVGQQRLHLPPMASVPASAAYVQFLPGEVTLARHAVPGISVRNQLAGQVRQIVSAPAGVFVAVDIGQIVWSEITPEAAAELQLATGAPVTCLIKTHSLQVVG